MSPLIFPSIIPQKRQSPIRASLASVVQLFRTYCVNLFPPDLERDASKKRAETRPPDALAGLGLVGRAVIGADEIASVLGEKAVVDPIERQRNVSAAVHVRVMRALEIDDKRLDRTAARLENKFRGRALRVREPLPTHC